MKKINFKKIYKKLFIIAFAVYVIYTFFMQQQTLNEYIAEEKKYTHQIEEAKKEQTELVELKNNLNSDAYIEQMAREKLDMYLPNERVYIDIGK